MSNQIEEISKLYNYELFQVNVMGKKELELLKQYEQQLQSLLESKN